MKLKKDKLKTILIILNILVLIGLIADVIVIRGGLVNVSNRVSYVSDTADVILSEVGNMKSDIEATLEEENSLLEEWSINVSKTDFEEGTYTVDITIIPKTYTDAMEAVIYFGTKEHNLKHDGFKYVGKATLPITESYDGNVTVLFVDGNKKSTEVMSNYVGPIESWRKVLSGSISELPTVKEEELSLKGDLEYKLDGLNKDDVFTEFKLVVENADTSIELTSKDLLENENDADSKEEDSSETEENGPEPVNSLEGTISLDETATVRESSNIRIYLRAVSEAGYIYEYDLFNGLVAKEEGFEFAEDYQEYHSYIKDEKGKFELPAIEKKKDESE